MNNSTLLFTSSWATPLPDNFKRIGISRGAPRRGPAGYKMYRALAPGREWFKTASTHEFRQLYMEILGKLDAQKVVDDILALADGKTPALLCFEQPTPGEDWCHRSLVAVWLHDELALEVKEYGQEHEGCGWCHPELSRLSRRRFRLSQAASLAGSSRLA